MQRPHQKLIVWQEAYSLCLLIYKTTKKFPPEERYALCDQLRRAASSVPTNITEGNYRTTQKDRRHFFVIAHSSLEALHCEILLANDLGYISTEEFACIDSHIGRVGFLLNRLMKTIK